MRHLGDSPVQGPLPAAATVHVAQRLERWRQGQAEPIQATDGPEDPSVMIVLEHAALTGRRFHRLWISFGGDRRGCGTGALLALVGALGRRIAPFHACVEHEALQSLFFTVAEPDLDTMPEALRGSVPEPQVSHGALDLGLLLQDQIGPVRVPPAIWTVNLFGAAQVAAIGRQRLLQAGWHSTCSLEQAVLAMVLEGPADTVTDAAAEPIARITRALALPRLQRASRAESGRPFTLSPCCPGPPWC
ncbi:hypothetical protein EBE87_15465 [Pseudoroseomonas wenyumeiae]|uniref:Uncharacterized protein n=1 Tax=Teichococcus wenyumeiae TaxID=2478470 RepID=A0A3A9JC16_9PROT|nr:hypothetical protein [Pseudoroseomonas wenyumeiae]RKK03690.1 hypothetical protein D6Z83_13355 [Pseudoroseomonas wenyumeiae]RMI20536.1 hypothetical protein EBE87_15465 [Pseudoroseomonas wenyumeiae]